MKGEFTHLGKEVLRGREHIADARDDAMAERIAKALNAYRRRFPAFPGGKPAQAKGGYARAAALTPEERSQQAQAAARARWGKKP